MTWVKGQSGNPGGKGRLKPISDALLLELKAEPKRARRIARRLLDMAEGGDLQAMKEVADRLEGKAAQAIDITDNRQIADLSERWARAIELTGKVIEDVEPERVPQLEDQR